MNARRAAALLPLLALLAAGGCGDDDDPVSPSDHVIDFPGEAATLREAIASASAGDTVRVGAGTHAVDSTLVFDPARAGVVLIGRAEGSAAARPVLNLASGDPLIGITVEIGATGVTIRGLELRGSLSTGIRVRGTGCRVADCAVINAPAYGVSCEFAEANATIEGNLIVRPGVFGVYCDAGSIPPIVEQNTIYGAGDCGIFVNVGEPVLSRNLIARSANFGVACDGFAAPELACNDVFGSGNTAYSECGPGAGDIAADPLFCDTTAFELAVNSPCAPAQAGECGRIGAAGVGCQGAAADHVIDFPGDGISLQEAIGAAALGDTIRVAPGTYELTSALVFSETVSGLTLVGRAEGSADPRPALRIASAVPRTGIALDVGSSAITIRGISLGGDLDIGVEARGTGCRIMDCEILRPESYGISCDFGASDPLIEGNLIVRPGLFGVFCDSGAHPTVTRNTIYGAGDCGVYTIASSPFCSRNVIAWSAVYGFVCNGPIFPELACNALYGSGGDDYGPGCTPGAGDIHADPQFCDTLAFGIAEASPCAPASAGACGGMGAGAVACVEPADRVIHFPGDGMTLSEAVASAGPGDTIRVDPGTHAISSTVVFDSTRADIVLLGRSDPTEGQRPVLVMSGPSRRTGFAIDVGAREIVIQGIDLRGALDAGIQVRGTGCRITDCALRRVDTYGIICDYIAADPLIEWNLITWAGIFGVYCESGSQPIVRRNTIYGSADCGIRSYFSRPTCERNIVAASSLYGIICTGPGITLSCNALFQNGLADYSGSDCGFHPTDIHADPLFCDTTSFAISADSPCAPAHAGECGGMGIPFVGCP